MMTPEEIAAAVVRIQGVGQLSGMEYEDALAQIALHDAPLLLAEVSRLQAELTEARDVAGYFEMLLRYNGIDQQNIRIEDHPWLRRS